MTEASMRAIVTGASSGIGKAIYEHLHQYKRLHHIDGEAIGVSRRGPDAYVDFAVEEAGYFARCDPCDVLVLNHGILSFDEIADLEKLVAVNLTSYYHALHMQAHGQRPVREGGCIILNASVSGVIGDKDVPLYAALKAGVINLARSYAKILLPQSIRVNSFSCGFFNTNLVPGETPSELIDTIPIEREGEPREILPLIDCLIASKYMTGQNIIIDGGLSL